MRILLSNKEHTARKEYYDDGWKEINEWVRSGCYGATEIDKAIIELTIHKANLPNKILRGDRYVRQFLVDEEDKWEFKTKKIFYDLICKYDLSSEN